MSTDEFIRLTPAQERAVQERLKGKTIIESMLTAYPSRRKWTPRAQHSEAGALFANSKVKQRYEGLLARVREREARDGLWTREQAINTLKEVIEVNKRDIERIEKAAEEELEFLQERIEEKPEKALVFIEEMLRKRKQRRASTVNNKGIIDAVSELNKMQGYNEENINLNGMVRFSGEDELDD